MEDFNTPYDSSGNGAQTPEEYKLARARKRVEEIKGFRIHLMVYLLINLLILLATGIQNYRQDETVLRWHMLSTPFFWGIGLALHAGRVFGFNAVFGKDWEARKIARYMEEDRRDSERFTE